MNYKSQKRLEIMNYIFNNLGSSDGLTKEFIGKLFYLSNKLFLLKYGCTITGDKFIAFERGTTCSETLGIMDREYQYAHDKEAIKEFENQYAYTVTSHTKKVHTILPTDKLKNQFDHISEKEKEVIEIILNRFGKMSNEEISDYTHKFLEWKRYEQRCSKNEACDIDMNDVFNDETFWNDKELAKHLNAEHRKIPQMIFNGDLD